MLAQSGQSHQPGTEQGCGGTGTTFSSLLCHPPLGQPWVLVQPSCPQPSSCSSQEVPAGMPAVWLGEPAEEQTCPLPSIRRSACSDCKPGKNKPCGEGGESQQLCPETEAAGWESTGDAGAQCKLGLISAPLWKPVKILNF